MAAGGAIGAGERSKGARRGRSRRILGFEEGFEGVVGGIIRGGRVVDRVVGVGIDREVGRKFREEVGILEEGFALLESHGFNASNYGVRDGHFGPVARGLGDNFTGNKKGEEAVAIVMVTSLGEGNGAEGTGAGGIGCAIHEESIGTKLHS